MKLVLALPGGEDFAVRLARQADCAQAALQVHRFPDGEQLVKVDAPVAGHSVVLAGSLDHPDAKLLPLLFAIDLLRELGAAHVGLVTPYLPYMRQDARFHAGEAITSRTFGKLLSQRLDFLLAVEPHLHRWPSLAAVYPTVARAVSATGAIAAWLRGQAPEALLVGPDEESLQWVSRIAAALDAPFAVLRKTRRGDRDVQVEGLLPTGMAGRRAVLVDDMVSTGHSLLAAAQAIREAGGTVDLGVCVHALVDDAATAQLAAAGLRLASCNTVPHASNAIDVVPAIAASLSELRLAG